MLDIFDISPSDFWGIILCLDLSHLFRKFWLGWEGSEIYGLHRLRLQFSSHYDIIK